MTGKVIDNSATSVLVLILPIALAIIFVLTAWPLLLALFGFTLGWQLWQNHQWKQWCREVNPYFQELILENQGCLTPLDLSIKAQLSPRGAQIFLEKKAEEYGAQRKTYGDQGVVYYFLTASALGSIFEDSEPLIDVQGEVLTEVDTLPETSTVHETSASEIAQLVELETQPPIFVAEAETLSQENSEAEAEELETEEEELSQEDISSEEEPLETAIAESAATGTSLIQADLAKRLDVHPSTVGKRKSDPDFAEWSKSRDPEGIAWQYSRKTRMFVPLTDNP